MQCNIQHIHLIYNKNNNKKLLYQLTITVYDKFAYYNNMKLHAIR